MRFEIRPPFVLFHDDKPGQNVRLLVESPSGGRHYNFRSDASVFSDKKRSYAWAFEGEVREGDTVIFSTDDRQVTGHVRGGQIVFDDDLAQSRVVSAPSSGSAAPPPIPPAPTVATTRKRPVAMPRPKKK